MLPLFLSQANAKSQYPMLTKGHLPTQSVSTFCFFPLSGSAWARLEAMLLHGVEGIETPPNPGWVEVAGGFRGC